MRERPRTQEEHKLEPLLRLAVGLVLDDHDAAALSDCLSRIAKHGDEIVHQLRRRQSDFLRHPPLIASGAGSEHSPKAGPGYLSGRFPAASERMRGAPWRAPLEPCEVLLALLRGLDHMRQVLGRRSEAERVHDQRVVGVEADVHAHVVDV